MSDTSSINTWSWVTGAIGVVTVVPLLYAFVMAQIPLSKVQSLEAAIEDTKTLLDSVVEKGLLLDPKYIDQSKQTLVSIEGQAIGLKLSACSAKTFGQQIKGMVTGVSYGIYRLCQRVNKLRADISETTSQAQLRLQNEGSAPAPLVDDATSMSIPSSFTPDASETGRQSVDISDLGDPFVRTVELSHTEYELLADHEQRFQWSPSVVSGVENMGSLDERCSPLSPALSV